MKNKFAKWMAIVLAFKIIVVVCVFGSYGILQYYRNADESTLHNWPAKRSLLAEGVAPVNKTDVWKLTTCNEYFGRRLFVFVVKNNNNY